MIDIIPFASSSSGNCYLIQNEETKILLECGVKKQDLLKYLIEYGVLISDLECCLISHEHSDHSLLQDYISSYIPIYSTNSLHLKNNNIIGMKEKTPFKIGTIKILPIPVEHGECENNAFVLLDKDSCLFFGTDFSLMTQNVSNFKFDKIFIECNYDDEIIQEMINTDFDRYTKYIRQISTHMGKKDCITHLKHMNLTKCKKIVLLHPSAFLIGRNDTEKDFYKEFNIETIFAKEK